LRKGLERVLAGRGEPGDLAQFEAIARTMRATSRCGLGQTSSNPVTSTLASFRPLYEALVREDPRKFRRSFDLEGSVAEAARIRGGNGGPPGASLGDGRRGDARAAERRP
jgi:hypothetical protein